MKLFKARRSESQTVREAKRRRDKGNIPRQEELISAVRQGRSSSSRLANELRRASTDSGRTVPLPPSLHCMTPLTLHFLPSFLYIIDVFSLTRKPNELISNRAK